MVKVMTQKEAWSRASIVLGKNASLPYQDKETKFAV